MLLKIKGEIATYDVCVNSLVIMAATVALSIVCINVRAISFGRAITKSRNLNKFPQIHLFSAREVLPDLSTDFFLEFKYTGISRVGHENANPFCIQPSLYVNFPRLYEKSLNELFLVDSISGSLGFSVQGCGHAVNVYDQQGKGTPSSFAPLTLFFQPEKKKIPGVETGLRINGQGAVETT